jgi:hypothetical protein
MALTDISKILAVMAAQTCAFRAETSVVSGSDLGVSPSLSLPASVAGESQPCSALRRMDLIATAGAAAVVEPTAPGESDSAGVALSLSSDETRREP